MYDRGLTTTWLNVAPLIALASSTSSTRSRGHVTAKAEVIIQPVIIQTHVIKCQRLALRLLPATTLLLLLIALLLVTLLLVTL